MFNRISFEHQLWATLQSVERPDSERAGELMKLISFSERLTIDRPLPVSNPAFTERFDLGCPRKKS